MEINKQITQTHTPLLCNSVLQYLWPNSILLERVFSSLLFWSDIFLLLLLLLLFFTRFYWKRTKRMRRARKWCHFRKYQHTKHVANRYLYTMKQQQQQQQREKSESEYIQLALSLCMSVVCSLFLHIHCAVLHSKVHKINVCSGKTDLINYMIALLFSALHSTRVTSIHL